MKLICILTDCPSPHTYFSLLGLLSFTPSLLNWATGIFTEPLYLLLAYPTHMFIIWLFTPMARIYMFTFDLVLFPTGLTFLKKSSWSILKNICPVLPSPNHPVLFCMSAALKGPDISEVLNNFFTKWVSRLFPLVVLLCCLPYLHFINH